MRRQNSRKHLKQLITEHLPNAQFVKSFRKDEPDNIVLPKTVSMAMEILSRPTLLNNGEIQILYNTLFSREEIFAKIEFEIFSREDIFANILFTRKYLPAKISSPENNFP